MWSAERLGEAWAVFAASMAASPMVVAIVTCLLVLVLPVRGVRRFRTPKTL